MAPKFFKYRITGAAKVKADLMNVIPGARDRLRAVIRAKAEEIAGRAISKVSGSVLNTRTGKLARSIKTKMEETDTKVIGRAYSNWYIAQFWEQGWGGKAISVRAHVRQIQSGTKMAVIQGKSSKKATRIKFRKSAQGIAFVKAHDRKVPRQEKPFLKAALNEIRSQVYAAIRGAMYGMNGRF